MTASTSRDPRFGQVSYQSLGQFGQDGQGLAQTEPSCSPSLENDALGELELEYPDSPDDVEMVDVTASKESNGKKSEEQAPCRSNEREQVQRAPPPAHARAPVMSSTSNSSLPRKPQQAPFLPPKPSAPLKSALSNPLPARPAGIAGPSTSQRPRPPRPEPQPVRMSMEALRRAAFEAPLYKASSNPTQEPGQPMPPRYHPSKPIASANKPSFFSAPPSPSSVRQARFSTSNSIFVPRTPTGSSSSSRQPVASQQTTRYQPYPLPTTSNAQAGPSTVGPDRNIGPRKTPKATAPSSKPNHSTPQPPDFSSLSLGDRQERGNSSRDKPSASERPAIVKVPQPSQPATSEQPSSGRPRSSSQPNTSQRATTSSSRAPLTFEPIPGSSRRSTISGQSRPLASPSTAPAPAPAPLSTPASSQAPLATPAAPAVAPVSPPLAPPASTLLPNPTLTRHLPIAPTAVARVPNTEGFSGVTQHFHVDANRITILSSDGDRTRVPDEDELYDQYGQPYHYERVLPSSGNESFRQGLLHWKRTVGMYVAAVMFGRKQTGDEREWLLDPWPANYTFWVRIKTLRPGADGKQKKPRKDYYLYGSPTSTFASPMEFVYHAVWLMSGRARNPDGSNRCECEYCTDGDQKPISARLERIYDECGDGEVYGG